jgi:hypothetical protein
VEIVEYAPSRTMSPALIAEYQLKIPEKKLLDAKLHEFNELAQRQGPNTAITSEQVSQMSQTAEKIGAKLLTPF